MSPACSRTWPWLCTQPRPVLAQAAFIPKEETPAGDGWSGWRYANNTEEDGNAGFVDLPLQHPAFEGKYSDHVPIDLPQPLVFVSVLLSHQSPLLYVLVYLSYLVYVPINLPQLLVFVSVILSHQSRLFLLQ